MRWSQISSESLPESPFDAALCLGSSLHHTNSEGIAELFTNTRAILRKGGIFVVEQRNFEQLFSERPKLASHPCGWSYALEFSEPRTIYFHLTDTRRGINVRFEGLVTFERELIPIAEQTGFRLASTFYDHGRTKQRDEARWIEFVFEAL